MSEKISLREAERKVFRTAVNDGLWDIMLGCVFLMWSIAPLLSVTLGDFWSSAVFLPFWGLVYLGIHVLRKRVVAPRTGKVTFGSVRKARLKWLMGVMLVVNVLALVVGAVVALNFRRVPGPAIAIGFGLVLLAGFSMLGYLLDLVRLYAYGLLGGAAPVIGEALFARGLVAHHGYPVVFGALAGIMILVGVGLFVRLLRKPFPVVNERPHEMV